MLHQRYKDLITAAIAAGRRQQRSRTGQITLPLGAAGRIDYIKIADEFGVTEAGEFYFQQTNETRPQRGIDLTQLPYRRGASEYLRDRQNKEQAVRTLTNDQWVYTALGKKFFNNQAPRVEVVAYIPVIIKGLRKGGRPYERHSSIGIDKTSLQMEAVMLNETMSEADRAEAVKAMVAAQINADGIIAEISSEVYHYDPDGQWELSEMVTNPSLNPADDPVTSIMHRPLGALTSAAAFLCHPEHILPEAWEEHDDRMCVIRQVAVLLHRPFEFVHAQFDNVCAPGWTERGVTTDEILQWGFEHGHNVYYCVEGTWKARSVDELKGRAVAFAAWDSHAYFYKSAGLFSDWMDQERISQAKVEREPRERPIDWTSFEEYAGSPSPGNWYTRDIRCVHLQMLATGRSARVELKGQHGIIGLRYTCMSSLDGAAGVCRVKQLPEYYEEIITMLRRIDGEYPYHG
jgi:hypothetical protein